MPRGIVRPAMAQRATLQKVAVQEREVAGAVQTVVAVAEAIDDSVDGGLVATLGTKLADFDARIAALEP